MSQDGASPLPSSLYPAESEFTVIGAALNGCDWTPKLAERLQGRHFGDPVCGRIWSVIEGLHRAGTARPDAQIVVERLKDDEGFQEIGGAGFLGDIIDKTAAWTSPEHADIIIDRALRRSIIGRALSARDGLCADQDRTAFDQLADLERDLGLLLQAEAPDESYVIDAQAAAYATVERLKREAIEGKARGLYSGLRCFDLRIRGFQPGHLIILAGRPSMGKTALALSGAFSTALRNPSKLVVFFALEMDRDELTERVLSEVSFLRSTTPVPYMKMDGTKLNSDAFERLDRWASMTPANLIIDDSPILSLSHIRRRLYALKRRGSIGMAFIDYLQIMDRPAANGRNDAAVIGEMTKSLKSLARELGICIVLLSQVNRGVEGRDDKRPQMSDLRESGAIEQDANAVLFAYREFYYLERSEPKTDGTEKAQRAYDKWEQNCEIHRRRLDVLAPKVRGGQAGSDQQIYYAEFNHVEDLREGGA